MSYSLSTECPENVRVYVIPMPARIQAYTVRKDGFYTICINESLCNHARMRAYKHEMHHIRNGDFDSELSTGLLEIRAHGAEDK